MYFTFILSKLENTLLLCVYTYIYIYIYICIYIYVYIYASLNLPIHLIPLSPLSFHMFVLSTFVSVSALQTGSSVHFSRFVFPEYFWPKIFCFIEFNVSFFFFLKKVYIYLFGWISVRWVFPGGSVVKNLPTCQWKSHRRLEFDPWVGNIPWRSKWQPTPVPLSEKFHGQEEPGGL